MTTSVKIFLIGEMCFTLPNANFLDEFWTKSGSEDCIFINYFGRIKIITIFAPPKRKFGIGESVAQ